MFKIIIVVVVIQEEIGRECLPTLTHELSKKPISNIQGLCHLRVLQ